MKRRKFIQTGASALAITGAAVIAPETVKATAAKAARPNRIVSETRGMEQVGDEVISVHRIEMEVDFEPTVFCDIPDTSRVSGRRRIVFPYWYGQLTTELIESNLRAYRNAGFDAIEPGPDMPPPMGFFVKSTWNGKTYHSGGVTGYDLTSANLVMFAPARIIFDPNMHS